MFDLGGRTALVTGASGGLGSAVAKALSDAGAAVALSGTRAGRLREVADSLAGPAHVVPADLGDAAAVAGLPAAAEAAMGRIDILVNNAGLTRDGLAMRMSDDDWQAVVEVNLTAAFRLSRAALRGMLKRRWGRIICIASVVGVTGNPGQANYAASKAGMIGMVKSLAAEVAGRGITANCVAPGFIATAMTDALDGRQRAAILDRVPAGRLGAPAEVAAAALYLASEEGGYVTGQTLHVNGGLAMI